MAIDIVQTMLAGIVATVIWFFVGALVYMNPVVDKIYQKFNNNPNVKDRGETKTFLAKTFVFSILIQAMLFAFVYAFIQSLLPGTLLLNGLYYGFILVAIKIIPRYLDMWVQSNYPATLLNIEFINGTIGSFVMAYVFVFII